MFQEIAPNMGSYLFMTFILLFGVPSHRRDPGLHRPGTDDGISWTHDEHGRPLERAAAWDVVVVHPARVAITAIVGSLYVMNVGLDEIFNPSCGNVTR